MSRRPSWIRRSYHVKPARWKRPALLVLSAMVLLGCVWAVLAISEMPRSFWFVVGGLGVMGAVGIGVALFGSDDLVALALGGL